MPSNRAVETQVTEAQIIAQTRCWLQAIVLRHNFCPFAHKPFQQETIRYAVSQACEPEAVAEDLMRELLHLRDATP